MNKIILPPGCDKKTQVDFDKLIDAINSKRFNDSFSTELEIEIHKRLIEDKGKPPCHYNQQARGIIIVAEMQLGVRL